MLLLSLKIPFLIAAFAIWLLTDREKTAAAIWGFGSFLVKFIFFWIYGRTTLLRRSRLPGGLGDVLWVVLFTELDLAMAGEYFGRGHFDIVYLTRIPRESLTVTIRRLSIHVI